MAQLPSFTRRCDLYYRAGAKLAMRTMRNPDEFMENEGSAIIDFGRFMTGFLVFMGIALPAVLAHSGAIEVPAMVMSILGGILIYGTIISFTMFFREQEDF